MIPQTPIEDPEKDVDKPVVSEEEPPVLEPIPHVASIAPTEKLQSDTEQPKATVERGEVERMDPTFIPTSEMDEITASQANLGKVDTEESELEPVVTADTGVVSTEAVPIGGDAEEIARRVFASPIENEPTTLADPEAVETEDLANATSKVEEAPVTKVEKAMSPAAISATDAPAVPDTTPALENTDTAATKPDAPVAARIAPLITAASPPAATTETTVSGPSATSKSKEGKGVSSWLKSKLRRSSKPTKPESTKSPTDSKEKGFVGGANLTAPDISNADSDHGDSSVREVAMAGKQTNTASVPEPSPVVSPNEEELYSASTHSNKPAGVAAQRQSSSSPSISSLSSDEDTRGRSNIPRDRQPLTQHEFLAEELKSGEHVDPSLVPGEHVDPALLSKQRSTAESSSGAAGEEFEEAKDTFDAERLSPPDTSVMGDKARKSDSPARDSRFIEEL